LDLVDAELLDIGTKLRFSRPRMGVEHRAEVTETGGVRLEDGQEFSSPSRAAMVAAGARALDGWTAWSVVPSGPTLDAIRQEFLDKVASGTGPGDNPPTPASAPELKRHAFLREARSRADANNPVHTTVRKLLRHWEVKSRGPVINQQIEADLSNHGLVTLPSFRAVPLDATVQLDSASRRQAASEAAPAPVPASVSEAATVLAEDETPEVGLTVGNLPSAMGGVERVAPTATFKEAITLMVLNGYSQLAVLVGTRDLRGAVTWESITRARNANPNAKLTDSMVLPREIPYDHDLIDILPALQEAEFVFVRDEKNEISGIVTSTDVVEAYGEMATPFFLIGELDQRLRLIITRSFDITDVIAVCDPRGERGISSFDDLTFGDYQQVLQNKELWQRLGWQLDRSVFRTRLDEIRNIRNDVMHFNPDPLPPHAIWKLRKMIQLVREYGD
jgi:CBS domain-containing protein